MEPLVYVVDDDPAMRESLTFLINSVGLEVRAFASAPEFLAAYTEYHPACLVLDVRMPGMSGLELLEKLRADGVAVPIIMITGFAEVPVAVRAFRNGVTDFVEKPFTDQDLLDRIHKALQREREHAVAYARRADIRRRLERLTERERQVLDGVLNGLSNKQIAAELGVSPKTIEVHRAHMMNKMGASSLLELSRMFPASANPASVEKGNPRQH